MTENAVHILRNNQREKYKYFLIVGVRKMCTWVFSYISVLISSIITFIAGIIYAIIYIRDPLTDPFILEVFISNPQHSGAPIGFKVKNTTQYRLKTDIVITPIVHEGRYSTEKYYEVINSGGEYIVERI